MEKELKKLTRKMFVSGVAFLMLYPVVFINLILPMIGYSVEAPSMTLLNWAWCFDNFGLATVIVVVAYNVMAIIYAAFKNMDLYPTGGYDY